MLMTMPRYEAREDTILDAFGGENTVRIVPLMGQTDEHVQAIVRRLVAALNGEPEHEPARIYGDGERYAFLDPGVIGSRC